MIQVSIPTELETFVQGVVQKGTFHTPTEVVGEALRLLAKRERLVRDVNAGIEQLDRGEYSEYGEESCQQFLDDIKSEERIRFPDAKNHP